MRNEAMRTTLIAVGAVAAMVALVCLLQFTRLMEEDKPLAIGAVIKQAGCR